MKETLYFGPKTLAEALALLDKYRDKAVIVNGGTDIVEKLAHRAVDPEAIVYIQGIPELKTIKEEAGFVSIGGTATYKDVLASPLCGKFAGLIQSVREIGSAPIRVVGTPAGNIGTAVPAADCNVALMALGARIVLAKLGSERVVEAKDMFVAYCKTQLEPGELIKEIRIPITDAGTASAFAKLAKRKAQDIAQVSASVRLTAEGGVCKDIAIALGAVGPTAVRVPSLEKALVGKSIDACLAEVKKAVPPELRLRNPRNKQYKEAVVGVLIGRVLKAAYEELAGGGK